jgi:glucokinase
MSKPSFAIGVDLGGTNLRIAAVNFSGKVLERVNANVVPQRDTVIHEMCAAIRGLTGRLADSGRLVGIGVGVPGIIDLQTGMLRESPNLPGWQNYPVREEIERRLGASVILENDANVAALGEKWLGAARHVDDMCIITLGTGVGGGLILRGEIWHGAVGMAGEVGHIMVEPEGPSCGCGSRGCVEQYASATAIRRMAQEAITAGHAPGLLRAMQQDKDFNSNAVYQLAMQGDHEAQQVLRKAGWALGVTLAGLINTLNLPVYVIGGGVSAAWDAFAPAMMNEVRARSYVFKTTAAGEGSVPGERNTAIVRATLGSDAGLIGAARLPMLAEERQAKAHH